MAYPLSTFSAQRSSRVLDSFGRLLHTIDRAPKFREDGSEAVRYKKLWYKIQGTESGEYIQRAGTLDF